MVRTAAQVVCGVVVCASLAQAQVPLTRINVSTDGTPRPVATRGVPRTNVDGTIVAFASSSPGLVPDDTNNALDVFVRDLNAATTSRISVGPGGVQADDDSEDPAVSADGRFVTFTSKAANLSPGACAASLNHCRDVYVYDRQTATLERVTRGLQGAPPSLGAWEPHISGSGRFVVFASHADNLVPGDTNDAPDIFLVDRTVGSTTRVSVGAGGSQSTHLTLTRQASSPVVSDDGRFIAFVSTASNLAPGGANTGCRVVGADVCPEVYLHDRGDGSTIRVSVNTAGQRADLGAGAVTMTPDARTLVFVSAAGNLGGTTGATPPFPPGWAIVVYSYDRVTGAVTPAFTQAPTEVLTTDMRSPAISAEGRFVAFPLRRSHPGQPALTLVESLVLWDRELGTVRNIVGGPGGEPAPQGGVLELPFLSGNHHALTFINRTSETDVFQIDPLDGDRDGMSNTWEEALGLDPRSSAGVDGASGDPDGDGATNVEEFTAQTHPRGLPSATRYFAEGATSAFFETRIALANPTAQPAHALLRVVDGTGRTLSTTVAVPPRQSRKVPMSTISRLGTAEFATTLESDVPLVAERQMWWNSENAYGSHAERAVAGPSRTWYFAEGATAGGFDLFYLLQNPSATATTVDVTYLRGAGAPLVKSYTLPPRSRTNIWVDVEEFDGVQALASAEVSAVIDARDGTDIIAERAMYYTAAGAAGARPFEAGHDASGITAPALSWFLAEGATGSFFDLFVLIGNPDARPARIDAEYLLPDGTRLTRPHLVPARSRYSIWVDREDAQLADTAVSTTIRVVNDVPVVVERAMWWPGPSSAQWLEAHASAGSVTAAARWVVADGVVANAPATTDTYVLVANVGTTADQIRVTLLYDDGGGATSRTFPVSAGSRFTVDARAEFPEAVGRGFGVLVESLTGAALVVERSIYNDAGGVRWAAGNNALGTAVP
ncbi:MAG TPA: hypothetical protein VMF13_19045 [Luteitalea sp.]|nr:hypothetical protein [Luteitalea sp.]